MEDYIINTYDGELVLENYKYYGSDGMHNEKFKIRGFNNLFAYQDGEYLMYGIFYDDNGKGEKKYWWGCILIDNEYLAKYKKQIASKDGIIVNPLDLSIVKKIYGVNNDGKNEIVFGLSIKSIYKISDLSFYATPSSIHPQNTEENIINN